MQLQTVGAYEAKTKLGELLTKVAKGESFTITKHKMPIAILTQPPTNPEISNVKGVIASIRAQRQDFTQVFSQSNIKALIEEGRE
jgi:antitoxin (DNA-binding transcriptional repressor) of toxin-antitoxin stability system